MRIISETFSGPLCSGPHAPCGSIEFCFFLCVMGVLRPVLSLSDRSPVCFIHGGSLGHTGACDRLCCFALRPARCGGVAH